MEPITSLTKEMPDDFLPDDNLISRLWWWAAHCLTFSKEPFFHSENLQVIFDKDE